MATGLSSRPIRVGDRVTIDRRYGGIVFRQVCSPTNCYVVVELSKLGPAASLWIPELGGNCWLPIYALTLVSDDTIELIVDDQGNFDTTDLSKDDITIIQGYINELSK